MNILKVMEQRLKKVPGNIRDALYHLVAPREDLVSPVVSTPSPDPFAAKGLVEVRPNVYVPKDQVNSYQQLPTPQASTQPQVQAMQYPGADVALKKVQDFYRAQMPSDAQGKPLAEYYPVMQLLPFFQRMEQQRPGSGVLGLLQAFYESSGGRAGNNLFGAKPGGRVANFSSPQEAVEYQYGPNVLGGGANPNMNIMREGDTSPLTPQRISRLYDAYDPEGAYKKNILQNYTSIMGQ